MSSTLRRFGLAAAALLAVLAGLVATAHLPFGERLLARMVEKAAPQVVVEGLDLTWPFTVSARSVHIRDDGGVWLDILHPVVDWHPLVLWRKVLDVDSLAAEQVVVRRLPRPPPSEPRADGGFDPFVHVLRLRSVAVPIVLEPPILGERVELNLAGKFVMQAGGGDVDLRLRAEDGGTARLAGIAGRDFLDLRWYLTVPRLERWQPLIDIPLAGRLVADGSIAGRLPSPVLTGTAELGPGSVAAVRWQGLAASLRAVPGEGSWQVAARLAADSPALAADPLVPRAELVAAFDFVPEAGRVRIGSARLSAAGLEATAQGVVAEWGRQADLRLTIDAAELARLPLGVTGTGRAEAQIAGNLLRPDLRAMVTVETGRLATGIGLLDRLLGRGPQARALVSMAGSYAPRLVTATIDGAGAGATLSGAVWPRLDLRARLQVPDLSVFAETLSGAGVARGRIRGTPDYLATWGVADVEDLSAAGAPPADGRLGFDFTDLTGTPTGTVSADLVALGRPVAGRARIVVAEDTRIEDLRIVSRDSRLVGELVVADAGLRGRLAVTVPRLARWQSLVGVPMAGSLEAEAVFEPGRRQTVRVDAHAQGLAVADATTGTARLQAVVGGLDGAMRGQAALTATDFRGRGLAFDRLRAEVAGDLEDFRFAIEAQGQAGLSAAGSAQVKGPRGAVRLERLALAYDDTDLRLADAARVSWGPDGFLADRVVLALADGGQVTAQGGVVRGRLDARVWLQNLPLALLALAVPDLEATGSVDGTITAAGTPSSPRIRAELRADRMGLAAAARAGIGRLDAALDATWADGRLVASATARDGDRLRLAVRGSMPLSLGDDTPLSAPVSGRIEFSGDLARLTEALPLAGHAFVGQVEGDVAVAGTLGEPRLDGRIQLENGRYENLDAGTLVSDLDAVARLEGDRVALEARGRDGRNGSASLDGRVTLSEGAPAWRAELHLSNFRALRRDDVRATVSGRFDLAGEGADGRLSGQATITGAEIDLGHLQGGGPVTLDVVEVNRPGGEPAPRTGDAVNETGPLTVALDIDVAVRRAFVRGRGLDSEWGGDLSVGGTLSDPDVGGRLVAERGRYEVFGRTFRLTPDSMVEFTGQGTRPRLDVAGEAKAEEIVARVELTGTPADPSLQVTSDPPLPRDEVLSRVLFGTEAGKLSAFQQIQLGRMAAAGLTGKGEGEGFDPIGGLRGALGLDVLEVGQAEAGGAAVSAGKYIGDETFLRVEQGTAGAGRVTVEQDLGRGFSVTTEVGQERGGGVGVEWRKDY